ncbi:MAG: hypothetical protein KGI00_01160 [Candidatus Micrarchaeota archaeon]|nr:hypothetical protein [Candidatus Micrarchaeota archaeon]MDE1823903.1 hypothetical protein [Candidatus Micrarchaeota archaeon]MDE1849317.1 hypothetical protein [Candidatus Micrarchaeota archaeon]
MKITHLIIAFLMLPLIASAGTVTLSGTCPSKLVNGNASFSLSNSGNESATSLIITLHFIGNVTSNKSVQIGKIAPAQSLNVSVPVSGNGNSGTFGSYFLVAYRQDSSVFSAIFPCLIDIGNGTASQLLVNSEVVSKISGNSTVNVSVVNGGYTSINASVDLVLPIGLSAPFGSHKALLLGPSSRDGIFFPVTYPNGTGSYAGAVVVSYQENGLNHASLSTITIGTQGLKKGMQLGALLEYAVAIVFVAFVILILRARLRRKG